MTKSSDEILKVERKKSKELVEAGAQEPLWNNEEEKLQCMRCSRDETNCGAVMLVRTRSKAVAEQGNGSDGKGLENYCGKGFVDLEVEKLAQE